MLTKRILESFCFEISFCKLPISLKVWKFSSFFKAFFFAFVCGIFQFDYLFFKVFEEFQTFET